MSDYIAELLTGFCKQQTTEEQHAKALKCWNKANQLTVTNPVRQSLISVVIEYGLPVLMAEKTNWTDIPWLTSIVCESLMCESQTRRASQIAQEVALQAYTVNQKIIHAELKSIIAYIFTCLNDYDTAVTAYSDAVSILPTTNSYGRYARGEGGAIAGLMGQCDLGHSWLAEIPLDDERRTGKWHNSMACVALGQHDISAAEVHNGRAISRLDMIGKPFDHARCQTVRALIQWAKGESAAETTMACALRRNREAGEPSPILERLATWVAWIQGGEQFYDKMGYTPYRRLASAGYPRIG